MPIFIISKITVSQNLASLNLEQPLPFRQGLESSSERELEELERRWTGAIQNLKSISTNFWDLGSHVLQDLPSGEIVDPGGVQVCCLKAATLLTKIVKNTIKPIIIMIDVATYKSIIYFKKKSRCWQILFFIGRLTTLSRITIAMAITSTSPGIYHVITSHSYWPLI